VALQQTLNRLKPDLSICAEFGHLTG